MTPPAKPTTPDQLDDEMESACSFLLSDGWREYPDQDMKHARRFYKRFDTPTRCRCNGEKEGMQICVSVSYHGKWWSYSISLRGELPDGTWINIHNHAMPPDIKHGLATIPRLIATWEFVSNTDNPQL